MASDQHPYKICDMVRYEAASFLTCPKNCGPQISCLAIPGLTTVIHNLSFTSEILYNFHTRTVAYCMSQINSNVRGDCKYMYIGEMVSMEIVAMSV